MRQSFGGVVDAVDDFVHQVVVDVVDDSIHEVARNFFGSHNFLGFNHHAFHIGVVILSFNQQVSVVSREVILVEIAAFPLFFGDDFFSFVVDVEDWSFDGLTIFEFKSPEHAGVTKVILIELEVLVLSESEFGLSHGSFFYIPHIVVIDGSIFGEGSVGSAH